VADDERTPGQPVVRFFLPGGNSIGTQGETGDKTRTRVTPANAGAHCAPHASARDEQEHALPPPQWIPAFAGMTSFSESPGFPRTAVGLHRDDVPERSGASTRRANAKKRPGCPGRFHVGE
jgi:hypothetical protein